MCWLRLDVRYGCMVLINILKSVLLDDDTWDAFGAMSSWNNFMLLSIVFFLLSFYSIRLSLSITSSSSSSFSTPPVQVRYQNFSAIVFISLFCSLILPPRGCWLFFLLLWLSSYQSFSALMKALLCCFETILSKISGYDILISTIEEAADLEAAITYQT